MSTSAIVKSRHWSFPVIDSHVHVWANTLESSRFQYSVDPPDLLRDTASMNSLISQMNEHGVAGALVVQPINHKFDHSYVELAIQRYPHRFKGMLLHDPSMDEVKALERVRNLSKRSFVGVRFNPYLWPTTTLGDDENVSSAISRNARMSKGAGMAVYKLCGELGLPVGIMCMRGLSLHLRDIEVLLQSSPSTVLILDHMGFTFLDDTTTTAGSNESSTLNDFQQLLSLASTFPKVHVKISAPFRLFQDSVSIGSCSGVRGENACLERVRTDRFLPLLETLGSSRLLYGSDFPYVVEHMESYGAMVDVISSWIASDVDRERILSQNAERLFGAWSRSELSSQESSRVNESTG